MFQEFKTFIMRGNVVDMAVGVILGGAFGKIVTSLVNDVIMPPIGILLGNVDFKFLVIRLKEATELAPAVDIRYGLFVNHLIDFTIVAFTIFMTIKLVSKLIRRPIGSTIVVPK